MKQNSLLRLCLIFVFLFGSAAAPVVPKPPALVAALVPPLLATYDCSVTHQTEIPVEECNALVALYNSTNGAGWTNSNGWLITNTPCSWFGIVCSSSHVMSLRLPYNQLSGSIPPEIGNLSNLTILGLHYNQLSGSIPSEIGNLSNLTELYLYKNQLSGSIPPEIGNLSNLRTLSLSYNQLSGSIPPEIGNLSNLTDLYLSYTQLSGSLPTTLLKLSALQSFSYDDTYLCTPGGPEFQAWLANIPYKQGTDGTCHYVFLPSIGK